MIPKSSGNNVGASESSKRAIFNRPAWAKTQPHHVGSEDFFRRSENTYLLQAADEERERKKRLIKTSDELDCPISYATRSPKRKLLSNEEDEGYSQIDAASHGSDKPEINQRLAKDTTRNSSPRKSPQKAKSSLVEQYEIATTKAKSIKEKEKEVKGPTPTLIDLEYEEGEVPESGEPQAETEAQGISQPIIAVGAPRDEDFPELARKAREKARRNQLEKDIVSSLSTSQTGNDDERFASRLISQAMPPTPYLDPVLQILITSRIPNTQPLIVNRRLSQRLKDVRVAWVERQAFTPHFLETVFLTWRGKRLFDVTSCKSLGINVDATGRMYTKEDMLSNGEGRVHMEAMTPEILDAYKKSKRDDRARKEGECPDTEEAATATTSSKTQVKVILKAKGFSDFKLIVQPVRSLVHDLHSPN